MDSNQAKPTAEQVRMWDARTLFNWTRIRRPNLLEPARLEQFGNEEVTGNSFLNHAGDTLFKQICGLPGGPSDQLVNLASELVAEGKTAGIKSKFTIFIHAHYVNCKLTTSQETDSRPKMWRCPTPPV